MRAFLTFLALFLIAGFLLAQTPGEPPRKGGKPVLIRDDPNEKKAEEVFTPSLHTAAQCMIVGDFYSKRSNWKAAEARYREAVKNAPTLLEAHEKLVKSLEKQKLFAEAVTACDEFIRLNPSSKETAKFRDKAADLQIKERKEHKEQKETQNQSAAEKR